MSGASAEAAPTAEAAGPSGLRPAAFCAAVAAADHDQDARVLVRYALFAAVAGLLLTIGSIRFLPGWPGAALASGQGLICCAVMLSRRPSRWLANIVVFGLAAGLAELAADAWLVRGVEVLRYPAGPALLASPAYMPVAWLGMLSAGIALGEVLRRRLPLAASSVLVAAAMGVYVPLYEALAAHAGWWTYERGPRAIGAVPVFIVLGEVLLALPLVAVSGRLTRAGAAEAAGWGALQGLWIFASYGLAFEICAAFG